MIKEIKIITYAVTLTLIPVTDEIILTVKTVEKTFRELFLKQQ